MSEDGDAVGFLGDFALDALLESLGVNGADLSNVGLKRSSKKPEISKTDIYNDNYDDDDDMGRGKGKDWEKEVDDELMNEPDVVPALPAPSANDKYYQAGLALLNKNNAAAGTSSFGSGLLLPRSQAKVKPEPRAAAAPPPPPPRPRTVEEIFPGFQQGQVLDFIQLFSSNRKSSGRRKAQKGWNLSDVPPLDPPNLRLPSLSRPLPPSPPHRPHLGPTLSKILPLDYGLAFDDQMDWEAIDVDLSNLPQGLLSDDPRSLDMVVVENWEDDIIYDSTQPPPSKRMRPTLLTAYNQEVDLGDWTRSIALDSSRPPPPVPDVVIEEPDDPILGPVAPVSLRVAQNAVDPYNLSNDHHYEGMKHRVRQTFGSIIVQHAYPAMKLQLPFYKTSLEKSELRSWHRPPLQFPANIKLTFDRVRPAKKMKDKVGRKLGKGGDVSEGLRKPSDLTIRDSSQFVLWEFSEEHPPIMSSFAMGSVLVNYYRKTSEQDEHIPRLELGEPFVLEPMDEPPYSSFAPVDPGEVQPTLYNNLIKAPLFQHQAAPTDFLVVRSTVKGEVSYYVREIKNLFVVGQTFPVEQIPGPHARKISATAKERTKQISFKLLMKAKGNRMKLSKLMRYFPDTHELQMRQRLKDFLEFHRKGPHQQSWRLRTGLVFPDQTGWLKMVTPELVCMIESMCVGKQVLQDAGYGISEKEEKDADEALMSVDQLLSPWTMSKTYIHSQRDRAWVALYGEGEPTGRGEGFSFIKVSMKEDFLREHETAEDRKRFLLTLPKNKQKQTHATQEEIFRAEARRIWDLQRTSLSNPIPPELTLAEQLASSEKIPLTGPNRPAPSISRSSVNPSARGEDGRSPSVMSRGSSVDRDDAMSEAGGRGRGGPKEGNTRVLRIKRLIKGEWKTEIIRDVNVINAYVRHRQTFEERETAAEGVAPTGDEEKDKRMKKYLQEEIEKLKKNQSRRLNRKKQMKPDADGNIKPITSRRCQNCGQTGHMKTNRKCPKYWELQIAPKAEAAAAASVSGLPLGIGIDTGLFDAPVGGPSEPKIKLSMNKPPPAAAAADAPPPPPPTT